MITEILLEDLYIDPSLCRPTSGIDWDLVAQYEDRLEEVGWENAWKEGPPIVAPFPADYEHYHPNHRDEQQARIDYNKEWEDHGGLKPHFPKWMLLSGMHRVNAARKLHLGKITVEVQDLPQDDWPAFALKTNLTHGKPASPQDQAWVVNTYSGMGLSLREIGEKCGKSHVWAKHLDDYGWVLTAVNTDLGSHKSRALARLRDKLSLAEIRQLCGSMLDVTDRQGRPFRLRMEDMTEAQIRQVVEKLLAGEKVGGVYIPGVTDRTGDPETAKGSDEAQREAEKTAKGAKGGQLELPFLEAVEVRILQEWERVPNPESCPEEDWENAVQLLSMHLAQIQKTLALFGERIQERRKGEKK